MRTFIINWYGAYTFEEIEYHPDFGNGIYLITGKQKYQRDSEIQYCGITKDSFYNRIKTHHKKDFIFKEQKFWLGKFLYPKIFDRSDLETAEKIIIYFWQPKLNERKRIAPPTPTTILNFWFKKDGTSRLNQLAIYRDLADVISWDEVNWRTGNLQVQV
ncbi:MAG: GIY-YIG nuclease family protein [Pyrinomonadaceae bacterium]